VNPTFEKVFGFTSAELIGKDIREIPKSDKNVPDVNVPDVNLPDVQEDMNSILKKGKVRADHRFKQFALYLLM
jgi:PAS domain S-box-containing protein